MIDTKYSPGVHKLLKHLDHLSKITKGIPVAPLHISFWPNAICNLNCSYCCGRNVKDREKEITLYEFKNTMDILVKYGTIALEFSGVKGEPTLWKHFSDAVFYGSSIGLKMSLITNGLLLGKYPEEVLSKFSWIRVSLQSVSHAKKVFSREFPVDVSGSFIVYNEKSLLELKKLYEYAKQQSITIRIAVARPCSQEWENTVRKAVEEYGLPFFFAEKERGQALGCYMAWIRGAVSWDGWFLPCPSIELNAENEGFIPENFKLCHISNLEEWILNNPPRDLGFKCGFCNCGKQENDFVHGLLEDIEDVDFV